MIRYPLLLLALVLATLTASAQSETCPRVWRNGDSLLTDPAPRVQWLRDGAEIPGATMRWLIPTEQGSYAVRVSGTPSATFPYAAEGYAMAGWVFDELHRPIEGASVRHGAFSATTDEKGRFTLNILAAKPAERTPVLLTVEKDGYWRNASRQYVSRFHETETQVMLHTKRLTNRVDATKGGEMAYRGFTLQLPPNAVQTESGTPYNGTILLSVEGATPTDPDFGLRMPGGDFSAIDESGNDVMLYSYGYLSAEMRTEGGEKLELRPEAEATLRFYLPYTETHRPDSVPLWHFNEETAVWEQEGWSSRNGSIYEGRVRHFSAWNCDLPADRGTVRGRVIDCNGEPVKGGWVRVGQREVNADSIGSYWSFVPGGITFDAWASFDTLRGIEVPAQEERTLEDLAGLDFGGIAVWNPVTQVLNVYISGNVLVNLRLSIDGGNSWTEKREFEDIAAAPSEVHLDGGVCSDRLRVITLKRLEDCRKLSIGETVRLFTSLEEALTAEQVYMLRISGNFTGNWDLLLHFGCLSDLSVNSNQLTFLPEEIENLTSLQTLDLGGNRLISLPEGIGNLAALRTLELNSNLLSSLPESIGNLSSLQELNLTFNSLTSLPESIGALNALQELYLIGNSLTSLPESIGALNALQELYLNFNSLTSLPESLGDLNNLKFLNLENNRLIVLSNSFCKLSSLQGLNLMNNQLTALPDNIGYLTALQNIDLWGNRLTSLPESVGDLINLQGLSLWGNGLIHLPESIGNLSALEELRLESNQLEFLPETIGNLESLRSLSLNGNQLTDLPASIANLADTLELLTLFDNPIPVERRAAIQAMLPNTTITW